MNSRSRRNLSSPSGRLGANAAWLVAVCQLRQPHSDGRAYFDRRVAEGKTKKEALRAQAPSQ